MFVGVLGIRKFDEEIRKKKTFVKYFNYALLWPPLHYPKKFV